MRRLVGSLLCAAILCSLLVILGCGSSSPVSSPSFSPSTQESPPLSEMRSFAQEHHATEAWWVQTSVARAFELQRAAPSPAVPPDTPVYVLVMRGSFGGADGRRYAWALSVFGIPGVETWGEYADPVDTKGLTLTPLPLASP